MNCPLCNEKSSLRLQRAEIAELRSLWLSAFGFDPFPPEFPAKFIDKMKCSKCQLAYFDPPYFGEADFYTKISKNPWYYEQGKWEFDIAAEIVSKSRPQELLEIGCGNGYFLEKLTSLGINAEGVDINREAVELCKRKGLNAKAINVFEITKSYDAVVLFQVLEHMEGARELFEFLSKKLVRPGGMLIISVPDPSGYLKEMDTNLLDMPPHHNSCWDISTFLHLREQFGLELESHRKEVIRYPHYLGLLQNTIAEQSRLTSQTWKTRMFFKIQFMVTKLLAPLNYLRDRELIGGQTHLVVLRNVR